MGTGHSTRRCEFDGSGEVNFDHFQILRAIGKGSFGKVCIVQKKDTNKMYAMKYMNKSMCIEKDAVSNVLREVEILRNLDHPFLVNVWFTFQDREDMFMVVDLLLGGDLRYHMQAENKFSEARVKLYICEIALALDYLQSKHILHRDIKPDNILLDEEGHVHITDFNIATFLEDGQLATSLSGTKPYMAPEVYRCARGDCLGYSYPVDWWALGTSMYEMLRGKRPYEIHGNDTVDDVIQLFDTHVLYYSTSLEDDTRSLLTRLLNIDPRHRISTLSDLKNHPYMSDVEFEHVLHRKIKPSFIPSKEHLNCDPTFELEEMIIESKPLHKKKKRLAKQMSRPDMNGDDNPLKVPLENLEKEFLPYNREKELIEKQQTVGNGSQCDAKQPPQQTPLCSNNNAQRSELMS